MKENLIDYFDHNGHLNEIGVALYCESLNKQKPEDVPVVIRNHVEDCLECKKQVFEVYSILSDRKNDPTKYQAGTFRIHRLKINKIFIYAAAVVIISLVTGIFLLRDHSAHVDHLALFDQYFAPYPDILSERGACNKDSLVSKAFMCYNRGDYQRANDLFGELPLSVFKSTEIQFYYAITLMMLDKTERAEVIFEHISTSSETFRCNAKWYLSLIYLKRNELGKARQYLFEINSNKPCKISASEELFELISGNL